MAARKPIKAKTDKRRRGRVQIGIDECGRPVYRWVSGASDAAVQAAKDAALRRFSGERDLSRLTLREYAEQWYSIKSATLSRASDNAYRSQLHACILPALGSRFLRSITTADCFELLRQEAEAGKSASHIRKVRMILRQIFRHALDDGSVERDPTRLLPLPEMRQPNRRRALTAAETQAALTGGHSHPDGLLLLLLYYLGLRRGEALGLQWTDIDWTSETVHIQRDVDFAQGSSTRLGRLKTPASDRVLPIPDDLLAVLRSKRGIGLLIHAAHSGDPISEATFKRKWASLCQAMGEAGADDLDERGASRLTPHFFRHNYATLLYRANVDVLQAQQWLGHTDIKVTLGIYSHLASEDAARNSKKLLGSVFAPGKSLATPVEK